MQMATHCPEEAFALLEAGKFLMAECAVLSQFVR